MQFVGRIVQGILKLYVLGLLIRVVLSWVGSPATRRLEALLDGFYEPILKRIRDVVKPIRVGSAPTRSLDLSPLILIVIVTWVLQPLLMWLCR
jgi:uncharacterized protein YggT (Ycf19 family)